MADNLIWLLTEKYPKEKIIVWAANAHIIRDAMDAIEPKEFRHPSLGYYFTKKKKFSEQKYVLGFTS